MEDAMTADLAALSARLQHLEDLESIRSTWLDYCSRLDAGDLAGLGDVFAEDADLEMDGLARSLDGTYHGRRAIIDDFYARTALPSSDAATPRFMTGHISTNMQIELDGDDATTLAYFFEIVDDNLVLIGTYQHRLRRDPDRWRFAFLRISVRYRARIEAHGVGGQPLAPILAKTV
jgi:ketosteroid isomerase-like protein